MPRICQALFGLALLGSLLGSAEGTGQPPTPTSEDAGREERAKSRRKEKERDLPKANLALTVPAQVAFYLLLAAGLVLCVGLGRRFGRQAAPARWVWRSIGRFALVGLVWAVLVLTAGGIWAVTSGNTVLGLIVAVLELLILGVSLLVLAPMIGCITESVTRKRALAYPSGPEPTPSSGETP